MIKTKYALLIISVCLIAFMFCMGAYDDTSLYWYFPHEVGIFIANPSSELHVAGTTPEVRIGDDDAEDTSLIFMGNAKDMYIALDDTTDDLTIGEGTTIGSNVRMVIENGGNIGIGTTAPDSELNIAKSNGSANLNFDAYDDGAGNAVISLRKSDTDTIGTKSQTDDGDILGRFWFHGVDTGSNFDEGAAIEAIQNGAAGNFLPTDLVLYTYSSTAANSNQLMLENDGQVGIGIATPAEELEVAGEALFETDVESDTNDVTLTISQCRNTFWSNSGAGDAQTFTLPAAAAGYQVTFCCVAAQDIHIDPDDSDQILPTCNSPGDRLSSDASQGSTVTLLAVDATNWFIINSIGTWSDIN